MSIAEERRWELIRFMRELRFTCEGLTAQQIVNLSSIYAGSTRYDRCFDDCKILADRLVLKRAGRPARWSVIR